LKKYIKTQKHIIYQDSFSKKQKILTGFLRLNLPTKNNQKTNDFTEEFYQTYNEKFPTILLKLFQKIEED
jgi:hypothetical protein